MTLGLTVLAAAQKVHTVPKVPKGGEGVKSGPIGLAVILVLCIAAYFLFKSMSKHLKKVREEFPTDEPAAPADVATPEGPPAQAQAPPAEVPPKSDSP
jgi:hypothetical protein